MKCDCCQLESEQAEVFRTQKRFFGSDRNLCPVCFQKEDDKAHAIAFWLYSIIGILALPATFFGPTNVLGILLLNIAAFQLFFLISTVLHELGHAVAGRFAGLRIFRIEIGRRRVVYEFLWWGIRWRIRAIAFGGLTYGILYNARKFRIKQFIYVLGGPFANAIILFISIKLLPFDESFKDTLFSGFVPFLLLVLSNVLLLAYGLFPYSFNSMTGKLPSDGLWLFWKIWRLKKEDVTENLAVRYLYEVAECHLQKDMQGVQQWIDAGLEQFPSNMNLKISAAGILYLQKRYPEALRAFSLLVGRDKKHKNVDSLLLNNIAYTCLLTRRPELLARADTASRLALKHSPWATNFKGTRGSVLVELGQYDEGLRLLHDALRSQTEKYGKALNACYIGIAEARRGNMNGCHDYFAVARKLDPDCVLLDREPAKNCDKDPAIQAN